MLLRKFVLHARDSGTEEEGNGNKEIFLCILGDKWQKLRVFRPLFITFAGQKEKKSYEKDIVCVPREYLSESDGGVRDEGPGG